ncbi:MAG TPA: gliding motility-associated C-terminal domain-containing protein, partial [Bacteroidales bacterium]|nr:gliding motility-associated C-terminal domain-containing protein [Bacteroidales bacterium]
ATGGSLYDFRVDGISQQYGTSSTFTTNAITNGQIVDVIVNDGVCSVTVPGITNTVNSLLPVSVNISADTNPICSGATIRFTATPTNGGTNPSYQWYNGAVAVGTGNEYSYVPVNNDVISVVLTSDEACVSGNPATSAPVTVTINSPATVTSIQTNVLCNSALTGAIDITATGGVAPYTYVWTGAGITDISLEDQAGLGAGLYSVVVTDATNCVSAIHEIQISEPSPLVLTSVQTNVMIFGQSTGVIEASCTGGIAPYQFKLDGGTYQNSGTFGSLMAGEYVVTVLDANMCTKDLNVTITGPSAPLSGEAIPSPVKCFGESNGSITANGAGGLPPYQYSLDGGDYQPSGTFDLLSDRVYTITIRDAALQEVTFNATVTAPETPLSASFSSTDVLCNAGSDGSIRVVATGGTAPYQYSINGGSFQDTDTFTTLSAGTHSVTVRDAALCSTVTDVVVNQPSAVFASNISQKNISCFDAIDGEVTITPDGGIGTYEFSLDGGPYQQSGSFSSMTLGNHSITIKDSHSCLVAVPVTITRPTELKVSEIHTDVICPGNPEGSINLNITGGTGPYTVIWEDGVATNNRTNIKDGTYTAVILDHSLCDTRISIIIGVVGSENCLGIPEIITPNGDGYNDTWKLKNIDMFPNAEVIVFNRWGKRVFESKNILDDQWDGTFKGDLLPNDSYHYILDLHNGTLPRTGVISIIR